MSQHWIRSGLIILAVCAHLNGQTITGRCVGVLDGDTISVLTPDKQEVRVRLAGIDAPEKAQPFGQQAKKALSALVFGVEVRVRAQSKDRYGRTIGTVYAGDQDVCLRMIQQGMAWHYARYANTQPLGEAMRYTYEARKALAARVGLWGDPSPVPPWEWRKLRRQDEGGE